MGWWLGLTWQLPAFLYLAGVGICLSMIDLDTRRLPNSIVLPSYAVAFALLLIPAVIDSRWSDLGRSVGGAVIAFAVYFGLAMIYPAGMGFGDVKFAGVLGLYLGWVGWASLGVGIFAAFFVGAIVGIAVMVGRRGGRKTAIPFGPFMFVGALIGLWAGPALLHWYAGIVGLS
jgi:leader peptidase (prepilin peptidase)/N-methyltransferase